MTIRTNTNKKFILSLTIDIDLIQYEITLNVTLYNRLNGSRQTTNYRAHQLQQAIEQYNQLNNIIFN